MRRLLALPLALALAGQEASLDLDAIRSRSQRYAALAPASRAAQVGEDLAYLGLHPDPLPGGHFIVRFPSPHIGEDPDVLAVPLDWAEGEGAGARAAASLVELAKVLKTRHFRPKHVLWLLWSNQGPAGMEGLIQSQEHQNKKLAHLLFVQGGWEGLVTASEGRLLMELGFGAAAPAPEAFRSMLAPSPGVAVKVEPSPSGNLMVELRSADATAFRGLEAMVRAAGLKAGAKAMGVREALPPAGLQGGAAHPLALLASAQAQRVLGKAPEAAPPQAGALAVLLARGVPSLALGLGVSEGSRPAELMRQLAEGLQDLP